jgi:PilZ domain
MSNRIIRRADATDDRRTSNRLPIEREVRYKVLGGRKTVKQTGMGKTVNMSSGGVLFTTETALPEGERVELAVSWPAQLNDTLPLKLVAMGRLVRTDETSAAISIERYEFKTRGNNGL